MSRDGRHAVLPDLPDDDEEARRPSHGRLLRPGEKSSSSLSHSTMHQQPESPGCSPNTKARRTLQLERGTRNPMHDKQTEAYTVEAHLEGYMHHRALLGITLALVCANGADAVEVLAAGLFMNKFTDANGSPLSTSGKGMLFGGLAGGWVSDRWGRKPTLVATLLLNATGGLLSAAAPTLAWLLVFRVIAGVGVGASIPCVFTLGAELFPTATRGRHLSYVASAWCIGSLYEATMAWLLLGVDLKGHRIVPGATWRSFVLATALPVLLTTTVTIILIPRSPRWLISQGRYEEASQVLYRLTGVMVSPLTLRTRYPYSPPVETETAWSRSVQDLARLFVGDQSATTVRLVFLWATVCYASYGIGSWIINIFLDIHVKNEFAARFLFALANVPGNVASFLLIESMGRRRLLATSMLAASAFGFAFTAATSSGDSLRWLAVLAACAFNACTSACWNALDTLSSESFPLTVRTSSLGMLSATGRLASIIAQFVNGSLEHLSIGLVFGLTAIVMLLGGLCASTLPREPAGIPLDQVTSSASTSSGTAHGTVDSVGQGGKTKLGEQAAKRQQPWASPAPHQLHK